MPPFAWCLLVVGLFCAGFAGHLEVAQTHVRPAALKMQWRLAFAAACSLPLGLLGLCNAHTRAALRQRWVWGWLLVSSVGWNANMTLFIVSLKFTTVSQAFLFQNSTPMVMVAAKLARCARVSRLELFGTVLGMLGAVGCALFTPASTAELEDANLTSADLSSDEAALAAAPAIDDDDAPAASRPMLGDALALSAAVCNAIYLTGAKRLVGVLPLPFFFTMVFWIGAVGLGLALLALTEADASSDATDGLFGWALPYAERSSSWDVMLNQGRLPLQALVFLFGEAGGTCLFVFVLRYADPLLISVVMLLLPIASLIEGVTLGLSEPPGPLTLLAVLVMLLGVAAVVVGGGDGARGEARTAIAPKPRASELAEAPSWQLSDDESLVDSPPPPPASLPHRRKERLSGEAFAAVAGGGSDETCRQREGLMASSAAAPPLDDAAAAEAAARTLSYAEEEKEEEEEQGDAEVELLEGGAMPRRTKFGLLPRTQKGYDKAPLVSGAERL